MNKKKCCHCNKKKTLDKFENSNRYQKGVSYCCKECRNERNRFEEYVKEERLRESKIKVKCRCKRCFKIKEFADFSSHTKTLKMGICTECTVKPPKSKYKKLNCIHCDAEVLASRFRDGTPVFCDSCLVSMAQGNNRVKETYFAFYN